MSKTYSLRFIPGQTFSIACFITGSFLMFFYWDDWLSGWLVDGVMLELGGLPPPQSPWTSWVIIWNWVSGPNVFVYFSLAYCSLTLCFARIDKYIPLLSTSINLSEQQASNLPWLRLGYWTIVWYQIQIIALKFHSITFQWQGFLLMLWIWINIYEKIKHEYDDLSFMFLVYPHFHKS